MGYDDIRTALNRGFSIENLHAVARISHELLASDVSLRHPAAAYAVAAIAHRVAWSWDGIPIIDDAAAVIEAHLKPKILAVLDAADGESAPLLQALDDLARAFVDAKPLLK